MLLPCPMQSLVLTNLPSEVSFKTRFQQLKVVKSLVPQGHRNAILCVKFIALLLATAAVVSVGCKEGISAA